jgi:hypothetical protein
MPVWEGGHHACRVGFCWKRPGWKPGLRNSKDGCAPCYRASTARILVECSFNRPMRYSA